MSIRPVKRLIKSKPTLEGAGVHLRRAFGFANTKDFDPFLLLDDFRNDVPEDYLAGFPWHPHRGIETVTYILDGEVAHHDSNGGGGVIGEGDTQWMTAGAGILHDELPTERLSTHGGPCAWSSCAGTCPQSSNAATPASSPSRATVPADQVALRSFA